uniref:Expressed protein n=1 Tax=Schizophyllum commune (strain H4-8 / FGSC 9210) TaxID=578458 RepID=D8QGH9_SCHCM
MDSGPNKIALGGIGGSIQAAAQYLQRKIQDPASTQNTASNARAAAEDLRHNTQMVLMAYIELQGVIVKILRMREGGSTFSEEEKKRIAQFFYSFGRHFDTIPGTSIQHTGEVETRWLKESVSGRRKTLSTAAPFEGSSTRQGLPLYDEDGYVRTSDQLPRRR